LSGYSAGKTRGLAVGVALAVALSALAYFSLNPFPSGISNTSSGTARCTAFGNRFLVIANEFGFNDSVHHGAPTTPWPILCVHAGDTVTVTVKNTGSNGEPHGFAIGHYYQTGIAVPSGSSVTVSFNADTRGSFLIFCNIFCSVHYYMVGELVVQ